MASYGYARVSTVDQDLTAQLDQLKAAGCHVVKSEKASASNLAPRKEPLNLLEFMREGDELVVCRLDRLARSLGDLMDITRQLEAKGAALRVLDQQLNTATANGRAFLGMLGVFAEFESSLRRERQAEGIAKARERGVYKGGKARIDVRKVRQLHERGMGPSQITRELGIGRTSVYRLLDG